MRDAYAFYRGRPPDQIYGSRESPHISSLCIARNSQAIADTLHALGTQYRLILCDLWKDVVVSLADRAAIDRYLAADPD